MKLHYQELGSGETVVILHGLFGSGDNWLAPARELSHTCHVVLPDVPNHGDSPHGTSMQYPVMASEVAAFLADFGDVHLVGHSMGGKIAMALALDFPERVRSLSVVDICPVRYEPSHTRILEGMRAVGDAAPDRRADADSILSEYVPDRGVRAFLLKSYDSRSLRWKLNVPLIQSDYEHILDWPYDGSSAIAAPTMLLYGGKSPYASDDARVAMRSLASDLQEHCIAEAGHWVHAEFPEQTVRVLQEFLNT